MSGETGAGRARPWVRVLAAAWAVVGVAVMLLEAIVRLGARGLDTLRAEPLGAWEWATFALVSGSLVYFEGYRALHRRYMPKVAERVMALARGAGPSVVVPAPLHALALWGVERSALVRAWAGVALIVVAVLVVRALPAPWRGIVDAGVALALSVGLASFVVRVARASRSP